MQAKLWNCTEQEYDDDSALRNTARELFLEHPRKFQDIYISKTLKDEPTPAKLFGRHFHKAILEPDLFKRTVCKMQKFDRRYTEGKKACAKFMEDRQGFEFMTEDDWDRLQRMVAAVLANDKVMGWLERSQEREQAIKWTDDATWIDMKLRRDLVLSDKTVDFKTIDKLTREEVSKALTKYGYHRQQAMYQLGEQDLTGDVLPFVFVMVEKNYPHDVGMFSIKDDWVDLAREQNAITFDEIAEASAYRDYRPDYSRGVVEMELMPWARKKRYSIGD